MTALEKKEARSVELDREIRKCLMEIRMAGGLYGQKKVSGNWNPNNNLRSFVKELRGF